MNRNTKNAFCFVLHSSRCISLALVVALRISSRCYTRQRCRGWRGLSRRGGFVSFFLSFSFLIFALTMQDDYEERRVRHEAAHFLSGYLCGLPIKGYRAEGGTTLVEFYDSVDGDMAGRALKFTADEVDKVALIPTLACTV